jgi:hypothetical protein
MTRRAARNYVEALLAGRRPGRLRARPADIDVVRAAIALKQAQIDEATPRADFVAGLFDELAAAQRTATVSEAPAVAVLRPRRPVRVALVSAAATVALVAGTVAVTEAVAGRSGGEAAQLASVNLRGPTRGISGEANLYRGSPGWVFMDLDDPGYHGWVICKLESRTGAIVAVGAFEIAHGTGAWAQTLAGRARAVHRVEVVTPTGRTLATATFD